MEKLVLISLTETEWKECVSAMKAVMSEMNGKKDVDTTSKHQPTLLSNIAKVHEIMFSQSDRIKIVDPRDNKENVKTKPSDSIDSTKVVNLTNNEFDTMMNEIDTDQQNSVSSLFPMSLLDIWF